MATSENVFGGKSFVVVIVAIIVSGLGLLAAVIGIATLSYQASEYTQYIGSLENRLQIAEGKLELLEAQIQSSDQPASGVSENNSDAIAVQCANLANRIAVAIENGRSLTVGDPLRELMTKLGC